MTVEHVARERIIQSLARALFVQRKKTGVWTRATGAKRSSNYDVSAAFRDAEMFIEHCDLRERKARRQKKKGNK